MKLLIERRNLKKKKKETYDNIKILKGPESIRENLGMYGGSKENALNHMFTEVFDNSVDEAMSGYCSKILVHYFKDGSILVQDNGRGIPVNFMSEENRYSLEIVFTDHHSGGKFSDSIDGNYKYSGGLHGVGLCLVSALASWLKVVVNRDGFEYELNFKNGYVNGKLKKKKTKIKDTGTLIHFMPDKKFLENKSMDFDKIYDKVKEISYLCNGLDIIIINERDDIKRKYNGKKNNIGNYVEHIATDLLKTRLLGDPIVIKGKRDNIEIDIGLQWSDDFTEDFRCYTNNIPNLDGGTHLAGFRSGITRTFTWFLKTFEIKSKIKLSSDDIREGLIYVINIRHPRPSFSSQTKEKLVSEDVRTVVESVVMEVFKNYCENNANEIKAIIKKATSAAKARDAARRARELERKKGDFGINSLAGKLSDCQEKDPRRNEIFIVEGDSAGGCWFSSTKLRTYDGREVSIYDLEQEEKRGIQNYCYTINNDGFIDISPIKNVRKTKENAKVIKIVLDNGCEEICTPDHKLMLKNGDYIEAQHSLNKSLMPLYTRISTHDRNYLTGYEMIKQPTNNKWVFTHIISDNFNIRNDLYNKEKYQHRHHKDFNKLNNNPTNIVRLAKSDHIKLHHDHLKHTLHRPDVKEKSKRVGKYLEEHPEQKEVLSKKAKEQWENKELIEWRSNETKKQWTDDFRRKCKEAYDRTYYKHTIEFIKDIFDKDGSIDKYDEERVRGGSKNLLKLSTFLERFFDNDVELMLDAIKTYNHKVVEIIELEEKMDVYDLEVPGTHNFALASGIFVHNSAKQGRDRKTQAILPLRGKVLNVEKNDFKRMLDNKELTTLITALGVGIGQNLNPDKLRYGKVIIFTDSDVDGSHIRTLLLTFFYRQMPQLIFNGNIYIAQPPLYRITNRGKSVYLKDDREKNVYISKMLEKYNIRKLKRRTKKALYKATISGKDIDLKDENAKDAFVAEKLKGMKFQRFKGLGEMNPDQLWETSMNPETRNLLRVEIGNIAETDRMFSILMADDTIARRSFIMANSELVKNLDV